MNHHHKYYFVRAFEMFGHVMRPFIGVSWSVVGIVKSLPFAIFHGQATRTRTLFQDCRIPF
jgi:hypothetical protein